MRHGKKFNHLGRKTGHRRALFMNLACALIEHKRINTTLAKAKSLRRYIEPLLTKAKNDNTHNRRVVFSYLQNKDAITELFGPIAEKIGDRPGGYVRVIRTGFRKGDAAEMAMIELVDFNEVYEVGKETSSGGSRRRRRRRGGSSGSEQAAPVQAQTEVAEAEETEVEETETSEEPQAEVEDVDTGTDEQSEEDKKED